MSASSSVTWGPVSTDIALFETFLLAAPVLSVTLNCHFRTEIMSTVTQACAVERINKGQGFVHSKARASMSNKTTSDALYTFTNESLLNKLTTSPAVLGTFESFMLSMPSSDMDSSDVLSTISNVDIGDYLPAESRSGTARPARRRPQQRRPRRGDADDDDMGEQDNDDDDDDDDMGEHDDDAFEEDSDEEEEEEEDDYIYLTTSDVPGGFESVVMPSTLAYIPNNALDSHYIMLCCDDLGWMLGKIDKFNGASKRLQLNVLWKVGDLAAQQAKLSDYFNPESGEDAKPGNWFYIKSSRTTTENRRRSRGEGEAESKGNDDDDNDNEDDADEAGA